jgi:hypothetical protein
VASRQCASLVPDEPVFSTGTVPVPAKPAPASPKSAKRLAGPVKAGSTNRLA